MVSDEAEISTNNVKTKLSRSLLRFNERMGIFQPFDHSEQLILMSSMSHQNERS